MTSLSKKLDSIISGSKLILPVKTDKGILVGDILIENDGSVKHIYRLEKLLYSNIYLNISAVTIANLAATKKNSVKCDSIYKADQDYGKWFVDSQLLRTQHQKSQNIGDFEKADMLWARYIVSRDKTYKAKNYVEFLCRN